MVNFPMKIRYRLIVLHCHIPNLDVGLDLKTARHRLIVLLAYIAGLHIRFNFHRAFPFLERLRHGLPPTCTGEKGMRNYWPRGCFFARKGMGREPARRALMT